MAEEIVNQETELLSDTEPIIETTTPEATNDGEIKGFKQKSKTYVSKDGQKKYNIPLDKEESFFQS